MSDRDSCQDTVVPTRRRGLAGALPGLLALLLLAAAGCEDPNRGAGDRCQRDEDCTPPLVCSNRDATDLLGICVQPEALQE